jgi:hypothetical protein
MSPEMISVLTSKTLWLGILTAIVPPIISACGGPAALGSTEVLGAFATVGALIIGARLSTDAPVTRRGERAVALGRGRARGAQGEGEAGLADPEVKGWTTASPIVNFPQSAGLNRKASHFAA